MGYFTDKTLKRTQLAEGLLAKWELYETGNLLKEDLEAIAKEGRAAEAADREQRSQITADTVGVTGRREETERLAELERTVRDVVPAVVADLKKSGHTEQALFLSRLSFARFRIREFKEVATVGGTEAEKEVVKRLQQVEREDMPARMKAFSGYCAAILAPTREVIADAFEKRRFDRIALQKAATDADAAAEAGRNERRAVEATMREHAAVDAQTEVWRSVRRLIRRAVRGDSELMKTFGAC